MATKITTGLIDSGAITSALITDASITADDLHTTLDLTGKTVTVATASAGDNDTSVASTAFVSTAIANLADSAPSTLDTLNELAAALGDDASFSTTVTNSIATKLPLAGGTVTGDTRFNTLVGINKAVNSSVGLSVGSDASSATSYGLEVTNASSNTRFLVDGLGSQRFYGSDNAETARFTDGKLGIGTTSPTTPLHVYHATTDTVANFQSGDNSVAVNFTALDNSMQIATSSTDGIIKNNGAGSFRLFNNGSERLRIDSSGKLLIGDTASHVDDLLQIETPASGGGHGIQIRRNDSNGDQGIGRIMFGNNNDTDLATIQATTDGQADSARLAFFTQPTSGASTERMRISGGGIVYFGPNGSTADPRINRHSNGYDYINSGDSRWLKIGASSGHTNVAFQDGSGGVTIFETAGSERIRIDSSGRVGINRTPAISNSKLEVGGADNVPLINVEASGNTGGIGIGSTGLQFFHGTSKKMTINSNYVIPKMNFNYSGANTGAQSTTGDEMNGGAGVIMLKQQITVAAGSRVMVWADSGQIGAFNFGANNPHMAIYIDSSGTSPSRGPNHRINKDQDHMWYPMSTANSRLFLTAQGAKTISTAGTYYIYLCGGSYNGGAFHFNYQGVTRGSSIMWAEVQG